MNKTKQLVGILGGMGPQAGVNMAEKLIATTRADNDQGHVPFVLFSYAGNVTDRTAFLLARTDINPAYAIAEQLEKMAALGVTTAVMACNTAHAAPIYDVILEQLRHKRVNLRILHLVDETTNHISKHLPQARRVGVLATHGSYQSGLYQNALGAAGLQAVLPEEQVRDEMVQAAIYAPGFGIKSRAGKVSDQARCRIRSAIGHLRDLGSEAVILGCTELSLAIDEGLVDGTPIFDPARIVAEKLVQLVCPE